MRIAPEITRAAARVKARAPRPGAARSRGGGERAPARPAGFPSGRLARARRAIQVGSAMVALALAFVAVSFAALVALGLRRRRPSRRPGLVTRVEPLPAGVKHLAARVSDLSDLGMHLPAATRALEKRRLGVLLGLR